MSDEKQEGVRRPNVVTAEMKKTAAAKVADDLISGGYFEESERDGIAADIARYGGGYWQDGYSLAKELDDRAGWSCSLDIAECLDSYSGYTRNELDAAEKAWAAQNNITPPPLVNCAVKLRSGETGIVTGVYEHGPAKFLVKIDNDKAADGPSQSRRIVNFEDAEPCPPSVPL